jgi:hypothetical protein
MEPYELLPTYIRIISENPITRRSKMTDGIDTIIKYLPVLVPVIILELGLLVAALVHLLKHKAVRHGSVALWLVIILLFQIIGPALYFLIGREEE